MEVDHRDVSGHHPAERPRGSLVDAEQGLAGHVVEVDLDRGPSAKRRAVAGHPFAAGVVFRLAGYLVTLGGEQGEQSGLNDGPIRLHHISRQGADVVEVDVDREAVQGQMKEVQRRAALQRDARAQIRVLGDGLQHVDYAQDLLQCGRWQTRLAGDPLQGFS